MARVRGTVSSTAGKRLAGALITLEGTAGQGVFTATSNEDGRFSIGHLLTGVYKWRGRHPGFFDASGSTPPLEGETVVDVSITLEPTGAISGTVSALAGGTVTGAAVDALDAATGAAVATTVTVPTGRYRISPLRAGGYRVAVSAAGFLDPAPRIVNLKSGEKRSGVDFVLDAAPVPTGPPMPTGPSTPPVGPSGPSGPAQPTEPPSGSQPTGPAGPTGPTFTGPTGPSGPAGTLDDVDAFLRLLNGPDFGIDAPISDAEVIAGIVTFSLVGMLIAGKGRRRVGDEDRVDVLGVLTLYYGLQEKALPAGLAVDSLKLWGGVEDDLLQLRNDLDRLGADVVFLEREGKRQFNLGSVNDVTPNLQFPVWFKRYVQIAADPLLTLDLRGELNNPHTDHERAGRAIDLLVELKGLILRLVRSLSKHATVAATTSNAQWSAYAARALDVLVKTAEARFTDDIDDRHAYAVLADLTGRNRDRQIAPYIVLSRDGRQLLELAYEAYRASLSSLDDYEQEHLIDLFQRAGPTAGYLTTRMREKATVVRRYPVPAWG